jgi:hypothetical protein
VTVVRPSYADVARRLVRRLRGEPSPRLPADRRRLVAAVEQALHARARRRARVRVGLLVGGVAAAAAVALFAVGPRFGRATDTALVDGAPRPVAAATEVGGAPVVAGVTPPVFEPSPPSEAEQAATVTNARVSRHFAGSRAIDRRRHEEPAAAAPAEAPPASSDPVMAPPAPSATDLAAQNDLFAAAVRAKKAGQLLEAARLFERLMTEHPRGPLVESAAVQRMKALATVDPAAGARAASDYLARFPGGFARPEAEALRRSTP